MNYDKVEFIKNISFFTLLNVSLKSSIFDKKTKIKKMNLNVQKLFILSGSSN